MPGPTYTSAGHLLSPKREWLLVCVDSAYVPVVRSYFFRATSARKVLPLMCGPGAAGGPAAPEYLLPSTKGLRLEQRLGRVPSS